MCQQNHEQHGPADDSQNSKATKLINRKNFIKTVSPVGIKIGAQTFATILILHFALGITNIAAQLHSLFLFIAQLGTILTLTDLKMKAEFTFEAERVKQRLI